MIPATRRRFYVAFLCLVLVLSACTGQAGEREGGSEPLDTAPVSASQAPVRPTEEPSLPPPAATPSPVEPTAEIDQGDEGIQPVIPLTPLPVLTLPPGAISEQVPDELLAEIRADLAARLQVGEGELAVVSAEPATWQDSSLGCPQKGMSYLQVITAGYWVVLSHEGRTFDYRADDLGNFGLCEQVLPGGIVPPAEGGITVDQ